jgi:ribose-phosphate pyrophosphokinase
MQVLNLKSGFCPYGPGSLNLDKSFNFSGGEVGLSLSGVPENEVLIVTRIQNSNDIMELLMATDAVRRMGVNKSKEIHLFLPYVPYARQDRVINPGEAHSLAVFTGLLKSQGYSSITVFDPHSEAAANLMDGQDFRVITNHAFLKKVFEGKSDFVLVSPDAGAAKKIRGVAEAIGYKGKPVQALKYRLTDGKIDSIEIYENDLGGRDAYIVDDVCDGGATFTALATELRKRNVGKISLVVSHGIFSKGLETLEINGIDHVYTTNSFKDQDNTTGFLTEVKLCSDTLM